MHLNLAQINELLSIALTIISIAGALQIRLHLKNKYTKLLLTAAFAAEKAIDKTAYNSDGTLNEARESLALLIFSHLNPHIDYATAKDDLEVLLKTVHAHAEDGAQFAAADPTLVTKPELGVPPTPGPVPPGIVAPAP